jgi:hypothetical protein
METNLENVPEIICYAGRRGSWPNIPGAKFTGTVDRPFDDEKKYRYTFNNLWSKKVMFRLEINGREFEYLHWFKIDKITTKK